MRASSQGTVGDRGEAEVAVKFQNLNWAVASINKSGDLGTDLLLQVRDERLFDLGLVLGAQVKTTAGPLRRPCCDAVGTLIGWWWYDRNRSHVDAWLAHAVPHILVIHSLATGASHWVHVTPEAVISTGQGVKIMVPVGNTIDEECRDALARVAASARGRSAWEGSAWTGATEVPPASALRYAMIVPRLVAPHPNLNHSAALSPAQGLAMVVQARLTEFDHRADENADVPALDQAMDSASWDWRLVGAFGHRMLEGDVESLISLINEAPDAGRRIAAVIGAAATLMEEAHPERALALLDDARARDDAEPVDHAWLLTQAARAYVEVGRIDDAQQLAAQIQEIGATHADDPTATAITGAAALLLFVTSDWRFADVASVVVASDTVAAWWQNQTLVTGLTAVLQRQFRDWSREKDTIRFGGDAAHNKLCSAALTESLLGDQGAWRHYAKLLAQDGLLRLHRTAEADTFLQDLRLLRLSGADTEVAHASRRLITDGPCAVVTSAAQEIELDRSTRTTARADLTLLRVGGDLVDRVTADRTVRWLLDTINEPTSFRTRTGGFVPQERLIDTLAGIIGAASLPTQQEVADQIVSLPAQSDYTLSQSWAGVVDRLPQQAWSDELVTRAGDAVSRHHDNLGTRLRGIGSTDPRSREQLLEDASNGSLDALTALGDVTQIPTTVARSLIEHLCARVERDIQEAHQGAFGMGEDSARALALMNLRHPDEAAWSPLVELIQDPTTHPAHKFGALRLLANETGSVPDAQRRDLLDAARAAAAHPAMTTPFPGRTDSSPEAAELVAALEIMIDDGGDREADIVRLVGGDANARISATQIARRRGRPLDVGLLLALAQDDDPSVRSSAAFSLTCLVVEGQGGTPALAAVIRASRDPGRQCPLSVATVLGRQEDIGTDLEDIRSRLADHPSAMVRQAAFQAADRPKIG